MGWYEPRAWDEHSRQSRAYRDGDPLSQRFYAYVPHFVASWTPTLPVDVNDLVKVAEDATRELNATGTTAQDASWLLRRAESASSSTIEGVHPSARRLARAEAQLSLFGEEPRPNDQEALRNIFATEKAMEIADRGSPVTLSDIQGIHAALMEGDPIAGKIRDTQNWIGSGFLNPAPTAAQFVPPAPERVPALMDDLVACINRLSDSPIIHAAIVHAQFETIHPFGDGNGRTGRALIHLMLRRSGLTSRCTPPISSALALNRDGYIKALNDTHVECGEHMPLRSESVAKWVAGFADATITATQHAKRVTDHMATVTRTWRNAASAHGARSDSAAMKLLSVLPSQPVVTEASVATSLKVSTRTARRAIRLLTRAGVLVSRRSGKQHRAYEAEALLEAYSRLASVKPGGLNLPSLSDEVLPLVYESPQTGSTVPSLLSARCGKTMPRAKRRCTRRSGHPGGCR